MSSRSLRRAAARRLAKHHRRARRLGLLLSVGAVAGAGVLVAGPVQAASFQFEVTNTRDSGQGTLRRAVEEANATAGPDTITFTVDGTIELLSQLVITDSVAIQGPGTDALTVSGGQGRRIFRIDGTDPSVSISNMTLSGGDAYLDGDTGDDGSGGAIRAVNGDLSLADLNVTGNTSQQGDGGGLSFEGGGDLTITQSTFTDNEIMANGNNGGGGAIAVNGAGTVALTDSLLKGNTASGNDTSGGGLFLDAADSVSIDRVDFVDNSALNGGGMTNVGGPAGDVTIAGSRFTDNTASFAGGLELRGGDAMKLSGVTIDGNASESSAGGLTFNSVGSFEMTDSLVSGNTAEGSGGGVYAYGATGPVIISGSSIVDNTADGSGGIELGNISGTDFTATIVNSTISGNSAGEGSGGGIFAFEATNGNTITIASSTIVDNTPEGVTSVDGSATITGSILANNGGPDLVDLGGAAAFAVDHSLVKTPGPDTIPTTPAGTNLFGIDPQLGALGDHGGATPTQVPAVGSPVIDASKATGLTVDQRNLTRPVDQPDVADAAGGDGSDMGAVEVQTPTPTPAPTPTTPSTATPAVPVGTSASCDGVVATIVAKPGVATVGTPGRDVIVGTEGADVISGGGGKDLICALGGDDKVDAGAGADTVFGGDGNDLIKGGAKRDVLKGQAGNDKILGGRANDTIDGGGGKDQIRGNRGNDKLKGGGGKDKILGGKNRDRITGGGGKDKVRGGLAKDTITKEKGENQLQ